MKTILSATLALAALTSTALADGSVELTDAQMDEITAGAGVAATASASSALSTGPTRNCRTASTMWGTSATGMSCFNYSYSGGSSFGNGALGYGGGSRFTLGSYTCTGGAGVGVGGGSGSHGIQKC